jgi:hypothetical protein
MKVVNRGFILVEPKQDFCNWAKLHDPDFDFDEGDDLEGNMYLIEEDFFEYEPVLESHFKKIMINECMAIVDSEEAMPKPTMELFLSWFNVRIGAAVFDTQKGPIQLESID